MWVNTAVAGLLGLMTKPNDQSMISPSVLVHYRLKYTMETATHWVVMAEMGMGMNGPELEE